MNKTELVEALSVHFGGNKAEANRALNAVLQTVIYKTTTEGSVSILGFGVFEKTVRPARIVRDPRTGEQHRVKALATPKFRAGSEFKAYVSGAKKIPKPPRKKAAKPASRPAPGRTAPEPSTADAPPNPDQ